VKTAGWGANAERERQDDGCGETGIATDLTEPERRSSSIGWRSGCAIPASRFYNQQIGFVIVVVVVVIVTTVGTCSQAAGQMSENCDSSQMTSTIGTIAMNTSRPIQT
jgi:hypothetical protein